MNRFLIKKHPLNNNFTGINTCTLQGAVSELKWCGLKLFLYLAGNRDGVNWTVNPAAYAEWLGLNYETQGRTVRKAIADGIEDLMVNGYLEEKNKEEYVFLEQKVPKNI